MPRWTGAEVRLLAERYEDQGPARLALELDRSHDAITSQARRLWLRSRNRCQKQAVARASANRTVNPHFFAAPAAEVAYVLGVIWACGTVKLLPRQVLRLSLPDDRATTIHEALHLLRSRHQIQKVRSRLVVEICNSRLVTDLLVKFGRPPGQRHPDVALPGLCDDHFKDFANGHLNATGRTSPVAAYWRGTPRSMAELAERVQSLTGVGAPIHYPHPREHGIVWKRHEDISRLNTWLGRNLAGRD